MSQLIVIRDGRSQTPEQIPPGVRGNLRTLAIMAQIVREDSIKEDIRAFVHRHIVNDVRGHDYKGEIEACFDFSRDKITYRRDAYGTERVADLWSTIYGSEKEGKKEATGDCGSKSVVLATSLASLGNRPFFFVLAQRPFTANTDWGFDHVYVGVNFEKSIIPLDPTPESAKVAEEFGIGKRFIYDIFPKRKR